MNCILVIIRVLVIIRGSVKSRTQRAEVEPGFDDFGSQIPLSEHNLPVDAGLPGELGGS